MEVIQTGLEGCMIIKPKLIGDPRGYFFESFNIRSFEAFTGMSGNFVQDNQSYSSFGVIRGLHAQRGDHAQAKLVRVLSGEVLDVAVDARKNSPTYGQHVAVKLSAENKLQLYIPRGFLHGFSVLSAFAEFSYKCDNFYEKSAEIGVRYDDPAVNIDWMLAPEVVNVSEKDLDLGPFTEVNI